MLAVGVAASSFADGFVILDIGSRDDTPVELHTGPADRIYSRGGSCGVFGLDASGSLLAGFGNQGRLASTTPADCWGGFTVLPDNRFNVIDSTGGYVQVRDSAGTLVSTSALIVPPNPSGIGARGLGRLLRLADGKIMGVGTAHDCVICPQFDWLLTRLNADVTVDTTFAAGLLRQQVEPNRFHRSLFQLPGGQVIVAGGREATDNLTDLYRYDATGLDFGFGVNARANVPIGYGLAAADASGRIYVAGFRGNILRMDANGVLDSQYSAGVENPALRIRAIVIDSQNRPVLFGTLITGGVAQAYVARFDSNGAPDATFNGTGSVTFTFPRVIYDSGSSGSTGCFGVLQSLDRPLLACGVIAQTDPGGPSQMDLALARFTSGGTLDASFGAAQADSDLYPDAFDFTDVTVAYGSVAVVSAPVTITGIDAGAEALVTGSEFSLGCNGTWSNASYISNGQTICLRQNASTTPGATMTSQVWVGGRHADFTVTAGNTPADSIPDAFTLTAQTGADLSSVSTSNEVVISGITGYTTATATGTGSFLIGCLPPGRRSATNITNGMRLCVQHENSTQYSTATSTTLSVGGVSSTFTSTTLAADLTPDSFTFAAQGAVTPNSVVTSAGVTISGINAPAPISVIGGEYSVGCTVFTSAAGTVRNGEVVCARHTSSGLNSTAVNTAVTIGTASAVFSSTTTAAPPPSGGGGGGGSLDTLMILLLALMVFLRPPVPSRDKRRRTD